MYKSAFGRTFFGAKRHELTEEQREAISKKSKKWWDEHPEAKAALAERQKGKFASEESRQKLSEFMKDQWANDPDRHQKTSERMTNTLNEYYKTHKNYWYGRKKTPEQIAKSREACKATYERRRNAQIASGELVWDDYKSKYVKPQDVTKRPKFKNVRCIETGETFSNHVEAAHKLGLRSSLVKCVLEGKQKSTGKYHFEVVNES